MYIHCDYNINFYSCTDDPDDGMGLPVQLPPTDDERATMCICKPRPTLPTSTLTASPTPTSTLMPAPSPTLIPARTPAPTHTPIPATLIPAPTHTQIPAILIPAPTHTLIPDTLMPVPTDTPIPAPTSTSSPSLNPNVTVMFSDNMHSGDEADGVIEVTVVAMRVSQFPYSVTITPSELLPVSASGSSDYSNDTIVVTFNPGETEKTVSLEVNPDCTREGSEFFNLTLSLDPAAMDLGITVGDPSMAVAEIRDTDSKHNINN